MATGDEGRQNGNTAEQLGLVVEGALPLGSDEDSDILSDRAAALAQEKHFTEALSLAQSAIALDPTNDHAHVVASWILMQKGEFGRSEVLLKRAIALNPGNEDARKYLVIVNRVITGNPCPPSVRASFAQRVAAHAIDSVLLMTVHLLLIVPMLIADGLLRGKGRAEAPVMLSAVILGMYFGLPVLYFMLWESSKTQASLGKLALGIRVETADGKRLTPLHAFGRSAAKLLSGLFLGIGYALMLIVPEKSTLHDQLTRTWVVKHARRPLIPGRPTPSPRNQNSYQS